MRKFLLPVLILLCCICHAQINPQQELHYNYLGVKDGLPEGLATVILQDKKGYLWIGTQNGLVRYDGYTLKKYNLSVKDIGPIAISAIFEGTNTDLWIGTHRGLYFYNRASDAFNKFDLPVEKLAVFAIFSIREDHQNNIWIAFGNQFAAKNYGVASINKVTKKITIFSKEGKGAHHISSSIFYTDLTVDNKNRVWIGTDKGLLEYQPVQKKFITHYLNNDTVNPKLFMNLYNDSTAPDILWFSIKDVKSGRWEGVGKYDVRTNTVRTYRYVPANNSSINGDTSFPVLRDSKHRLWFGTTNGLAMYNPLADNFTNYNIKDKKVNLFDNTVESITENKDGNFWCRTDKGIAYFNTHTNTFYRDTVTSNREDGLLSNYITNLIIDKAGTPWWGVAQMGVQWVNKNRSRFTLYKKNIERLHNFPGGEANSFAEDKKGNFWIGSEHGLYYWQPTIDSFTHIDFLKTGFKNINVSAVMLDNKGNLWFHAFDNQQSMGGLYYYNIATHNLLNYRNKPGDSTSLSDNSVYKILQDKSGAIWIGTRGGGLCRFNVTSQNFTRYPYIHNDGFIIPKTDSLDDDEIFTIYQDKNEVLWIGTNNGGLSKFNPQTSRFTSYLSKLPAFFIVVAIFNDSKGRLWAGTYENGLFAIDEANSIKKFLEKDGLLYDGNWGINEDKHGNIWLASPRGLSILNQQNNTVRTITAANGLPQFPSKRGLYKTSKGLFLFGTKDGFIQLNPDDFVPDTTVPIMHIETVAFNNPQSNSSFKKDSSIVRYGKDKINLKYNENRITFSYVGLLYQNTASIQYEYKLDGYDKDWIKAGTQRSATYTNLSPGTYTFHVKAANSDGVWTTKEDAITVIISPPWWKTWWAYIIYTIVFLAALRAYVVYRSRTLRRQNKLLEEKVERRTHQLSEANEELKVSQENIAAQRDELSTTVDVLKSTQAQLIQSEKMASLGELTAGIAHEIQNPLNFVNNFSDVNQELLAELKEEADKGNIDEVKAIANDVIDNEEKINHHGKRADAIVKGMLQHSRVSTGEKVPTNINALADEYLRLSYHGFRAKDKFFNATIQTDFDESIGKISIVPQDIGRVLLNLYNNAFYAASLPPEGGFKDPGYKHTPTVWVSTKRHNDKIIINVKDNGPGIPQKILDKIYQPFFTTKPTGQGTGLGLSLSYDIIKAHGGEIKVETKKGEGTEFIIVLPLS